MQSFTLFRPSTTLGALTLSAVALCCLAAGVFFLLRGLGVAAGLHQAWYLLGGGYLAGLGIFFAYLAWACFGMSYLVDRNAVTLRWGGIRQVVPVVAIERLIPASHADDAKVAGLNWPGLHVGRGHVPDLGEVLFYSTHRSMADVLFLQTASQTYAISVPDPVFFAQTVQSQQERGPLFETRQAVHRRGLGGAGFWQDRGALLLSALLVASFAAVLVYVLNDYSGLAQRIALRFPALGGIARMTDKSALLDIPRTGAAIMGVNLALALALHSWEKMVAYVLLLAGIGIQATLLIAALVAVA
jgi:hypothetical protein